MVGMVAPLDTGVTRLGETSPPPREPEIKYPLRDLNKEEVLYLAGDPAEFVFQLEEGLLKLSLTGPNGKERIVSLMGPGDYVGALTPSRSLYQESAEALSPRVTVRCLRTIDLNEDRLSQISTAIGEHMLRLQSVLQDSEFPVNARLARTLVRLGDRFGHTSDYGVVHLTLPLTHDNLAAMIGAARETTTGVLGEMRSQNLIIGTRGNYSFNRNRLHDFVSKSTFT
jgi:CRP-like cAMP-binding protein